MSRSASFQDLSSEEPGPEEFGVRGIDPQLELLSLREALRSRTLTGQATGLLAAQLNLSTDQAWQVLCITSNLTNLKARDVARIMVAGHDRALTQRDAASAAQISQALPAAVLRARHRRTCAKDD